MDAQIDIASLKKLVIEFRDARDWKQFHDPKNLAAALAIESAELQELFLWKSEEEVRHLIKTDKGHKRIKEELADIFIFLLYLSDACGVDLSNSVMEKIKINEEKYPQDRSFGSHRKYDEIT